MRTVENTPNQTGKDEPSPARIFDTLLYSHLRADALKTAIELELFTAIADGARVAGKIAARCGGSERSIGALCNFLTVNGFLTKSHDAYDLTPEARLFLNRHSPAYVGSVAAFMAGSCRASSGNLYETIKSGRPPENSNDHPWLVFAESMIPLAAQTARATAERLAGSSRGPIDVLDIAASHGEFGLAVARMNPSACITALDLPGVVDVAAGRAKQAGFGSRYRTIAGDVFNVPLGGPYDLVLLPNLLHMFGRAKNLGLLEKIFAALKPGGRLATVEFIPNEDRVSPPWPAQFSLIMIAQNDGDTYTFEELESALRTVGFRDNELYGLSPSPQSLVISLKP